MKDNIKIGIIAGNGTLPEEVVNAAIDKKIKPFLVLLKGIAEDKSYEKIDKLSLKITSVGKIISELNKRNIKKIIFAGGLKRPSFANLIPDKEGLRLLNRIRKHEKSGDNSLLKEIIKFMEEKNFEVLGADEIAPEILAGKGLLAGPYPDEEVLENINFGVKESLAHGEADLGQAVIVKDFKIISKESSHGTEKLIESCGKQSEGAILVKMMKPNQDRRIDLPAIGPKTIELLKKHNMKGVAVDTGNLLILEKSKTYDFAKKLEIFIFGV